IPFLTELKSGAVNSGTIPCCPPVGITPQVRASLDGKRIGNRLGYAEIEEFQPESFLCRQRRMRKPSVFVIFLTVFIDLIGFGIVLPLLPLFVRNHHASGLLIGIIQASFSAMQFLFAPAWGRLSDRIGRRPVLLTSTAAAALSYLVFAYGCGLEGP